MLGRDPNVDVDGRRRPLMEYMMAQEDEFALAGAGLSGWAGSEAPVVHLDQPGPLLSDRDGSVLVDGPWGIYFRMGEDGHGDHGRRPAGAAGQAEPRPLRPREPRARG
jgi:hypothetical protein